MNKQTVRDVDEALERWHRRLTMCVRKIDELRAKRKKMLTGKLKVPPPPGKKVLFETPQAVRAEFDDPLPSFGSSPAIGGG
jgi:hypothetical protein